MKAFVVVLSAVLAYAHGAVIGAPSQLIRTPQFDSAVIQSERLGGNFAYSSMEAHAYAAVSPVIENVQMPVGVSYHEKPIIGQVTYHEPAQAAIIPAPAPVYAPVAPVAPIYAPAPAPVVPAAPVFADYAPAPAAPVAPAYPAYPAYPASPSYPSPAPAPVADYAPAPAAPVAPAYPAYPGSPSYPSAPSQEYPGSPTQPIAPVQDASAAAGPISSVGSSPIASAPSSDSSADDTVTIEAA